MSAAEEFDSELVSNQLDPSVGVPWMRCSPDLPAYVAGLERRLADALETINKMADYNQTSFAEAAEQARLIAQLLDALEDALSAMVQADCATNTTVPILRALLVKAKALA